MLKTVKSKEIFDLNVFKKVRYIITQYTDNPVLALFSGKPQKVFGGYRQIKQQTRLLANISSYFFRILEYYGKEFFNMYTKKDYDRDYPVSDNYPFAFPWEKEYHEEQIAKMNKKIAEEKIAAEKAYKKQIAAEKEKIAAEKEKIAAEKEKIATEKTYKKLIEKEKIITKIKTFKQLLAQGAISKKIYDSEVTELEDQLKKLNDSSSTS